MDPDTLTPEPPRPAPQVLLTLMPNGVDVAVQVQGTTDRALISRMLAAAIVRANQPQEAPPPPRIVLPGVLPGVRLNGVRG